MREASAHRQSVYRQQRLRQHTAIMIAIVVLCLVAAVAGQRSPYLSSASQGYPGLLNKFKPQQNGTPEGTDGLGDRFGPANEQETFAEGTLYDKQTIDRVATWPKEKQPFWYVNREAIAGHRGMATEGNTTK